MKTIIIFLISSIVIFGCFIDNQSKGYVAEDSNLIVLDSLNGFKIGDAFLHEKIITYGFVVIKIEPNIITLSPIKLDTTKKGIDKILNGNIRFVPLNIMNPDDGDIGIESLGIMGDGDMIEFKNKFFGVGNIKLKHPLPNIASITFGAFTIESLNNYIETYDYTWEGRSKWFGFGKIKE